MSKLNKQISVLIITLLVLLYIGCTSRVSNYVRHIPDYENISSVGLPGNRYVARNIKVTNDNGIPIFMFELLKIRDSDSVHYYITHEEGMSTCGNGVFQPEIIKFLVDDNMIVLKLHAPYFTYNYIYGQTNRFYEITGDQIDSLGYRGRYKYYYEITVDQMKEIASSKNTFVFTKRTEEDIKHGRLQQEDIDRFKIFLVKYVEKWYD